MSRRWILTAGALLALCLVALGWLAFLARATYGHLNAARGQLQQAQAAVATRDISAAHAAISAAAGDTHAARRLVHQPIWWLAAAIPGLGDNFQAVRGVTTALDQAVTAIEPASTALLKLEPSSLVKPGGLLDLPAIQAVVPVLKTAGAAVDQALGTLAQTPSAADGAMVLAAVDDARQQLTDELGELGRSLSSASSVADIALPLLGPDRPRRYFFALLNPNESRPGGGFLGTWAVVRADRGQLAVEEVGSNTALPDFTELPIDLGSEFENRYGSDPALTTNSNLSPHFPNGAQLWLASYRQKTGQRLDGVIAADVVALGNLLTASGRTVRMPDGSTMDGAQLTQFALSGVYVMFPESSQAAQRKAYQEQVAKSALLAITGASNPQAMLDALGAAAGQRRLMMYVSDPQVEAELMKRPIGGSLGVAEGPNVMFATINAGANKLDAWLREDVTYEVGRCPTSEGRVMSQVDVTLTSDIPKGFEVPNYMSASQTEGPIINRTLAQVHLPLGAVINEVTVDGISAPYAPFTEQGRPSLYVKLDLLPRVAKEVQVFFSEPGSALPATLSVQPLALAPVTAVREYPCQS